MDNNINANNNTLLLQNTNSNNFTHKLGMVFSFAENTPDPIVFTNTDGKIIYVNHALVRHSGYNRAELIGQLLFFLNPNENATSVQSEVLNSLQHSKKWSGEILQRCKNGSTYLVDFTLFPIVQGNTTIAFAGIQRDISARKKIEQQLKKQLLFSKAINELAEAIISYEDSMEVLDNTARIIGETLSVDLYSIYDIDFSERLIKGISQWINLTTPGNAFTINNYVLDKFIGGSTYMLKSKKWLESHFDKYCIHAQKDGSAEFLHKQMNIKSGLWFPFSFREQGYYCLVFSQISYRRVWRAEEINFICACAKLVEIALQKLVIQMQIKNSQKAFLKTFNSSPAMMTITSLPDGIFTNVNENFLKNTGFKQEEIIGHTYHEITNLIDIDANLATIIPALKEGSMVSNIKIQYLTKVGEKRYGLYSGDIIFLGDKPYCLSVINDITDFTRYEDEMSRLERLNLIGQMAAGIGHEIRNPMTSIRGFLQIFSMKREFAEYKKHLNLMIDELDRANEIITEYLSMARNKPTCKMQQNLNSIIEALHPLIQSDAIRYNINLKLELGKIPKLSLDEKEIRQLILNLCHNALEAMLKYKTLTISTYTENDEAVILAVKDEGHGINPEILEKLGTPFFTTKAEGTGLGLAICYSICDRHNAEINIQTGAQGTTFLIKFKTTEN